MAKPAVAKKSVAKKSAAMKSAAKKAVVKKSAAKPVASKPVASKPVASKPAVSKPGVRSAPAAAVPSLSYSQSWTRQQRGAFIAALAETANVKISAQAAGKAASAAYALRKRDPAFRQGWADALEQALDQLEAHIIERAGEGVEKSYFYQGESKGTVRDFSDALAMFVLRARRPEIYGKTTMQADQSVPTPSRAHAVRDILLARLKKIHGGPVETLETDVPATKQAAADDDGR